MKIQLTKVLEYEQPQKYIVATENYSDEYTTPVLTAGKSFILGYTDETDGIYKGTESPVIIFDDFTSDTKYVDFDFKVKSSAMKILHKVNEEDSLKYFFYAIQKIQYKPFSHKRLWISEYSKFEIEKRSPEEQKMVVNDLDNINHAISLAKERLLALDELVKSRFIEMFGNCEKAELYTMSNIIMGQSPDSSSYNDDGDGLPFFQGKGDYGEKFTIVKHFTTSPKKIAKKGSVLMSVRAPVGPVNIASVDCCIGRGLCSINAVKEKTNNEFLYNALNTMQDEISGKGNGSTFSAINKDDVYKLMIPLAQISKQDNFSEFVKLIDKSKFVYLDYSRYFL